MNATQLSSFQSRGVVLIKGALKASAVGSILDSVAAQVDQLAHALHRAGKIHDTCAQCPIETRLVKLDAQCPHASTLLHKNPDLSPSIKAVWSDATSVLPLVRDALSTSVDQKKETNIELAALPNWNLRCKTPDSASKNHATVPFHQDLAYGSIDADSYMQLSMWVPLQRIRREHGPMEYATGRWFKQRVVVPHTGCWKNTWYLEADDAVIRTHETERVVFDEMEPGDVLLFDNYVPHRSLPNTSQITRWSIDLRWHQDGTPSGCGAPGVPLREGSSADWSVSPIDCEPGWSRVAADGSENAALLSPLVSGPWMDRWPMTNVNEHVTAHRSKSVPPLSRNPRSDKS